VLGAALEAADPEAAVRRHLALSGEVLVAGRETIDLAAFDRVLLVAAGKAAVGMARAAEAILGERLVAGLAVTPRGTQAEGALARTLVLAGGHPLPDPASLVATRRIAGLLATTTERDLVLVLLSGGASALMEMPAGRLSLVDVQTATSMLLASGATIGEMNTVRKHLSGVKGGGLARLAAPARLVALVLSDVVGSPPDVIASGPTVPDPTTYADAAAVLSGAGLWHGLPAAVADHVRAGLRGDVPETPKPGDPAFARATTVVVGDNAGAAAAAATRAAALGYHALVLTTYLEGEARDAGRVLAGVAKEVAHRDRPAPRPACLVAGGETTVTLRRLGGVGGRNQELALAAALALDGWAGVTFATLGTDGIDGATDAAGAVVDGGTVARARAAGLDPAEALARHDSGAFFEATGERLVTGPTGTNVNDLVVILVERAEDGPAGGEGAS